MATLTCYKQINMNPSNFKVIYDGTATITTSTHMQVKYGAYVQNYYGTLYYNSLHELVSGTVTATDLSYNGSKVYALTNGKFDVHTANNYLIHSNYSGFLSYLFAGNDVLNGSAYGDVLLGQGGNDTLYGNAGNDTLHGGAGIDVLNGGAGVDTMSGGDGSDNYYVDNASDVVSETNASATTGGYDIVYSYLSSYTLKTNVEYGRILATGSANLYGNSLNNILFAGNGNNLIDGSSGVDGVYYSYATTTGSSGVKLNLSILNSAGQATTTGISGVDLIKNIENIGGSNYLDTLTGNSAANVIYGYAGNDNINGHLGNDILVGGMGKDFFIFNTLPNSVTNKDTLYDFVSIDDTVSLENAIFTKLASTGTLSAAYYRANATGTAADANDYIVYNTTTGALFYDANGNAAGSAVQIATVGSSSHPLLTSADFIVT